jgi:tRNA-2-methylthio-N6-dimethylallyladenosine synthase
MFVYSEREGTPAAVHFEDAPRSIKVERLGRLIALSKEISLERNREWMGREIEVLVAGPAEEEGYVQGHSRGNHVAMVRGGLAPGIHRVVIDHATPNRLYGRAAGRDTLGFSRAEAQF